MNDKIHTTRRRMNRDNGRLLRVGNYNLNGIEILGYILLVCCMLGLALSKTTANEIHKYISLGLGSLGFLLGIYGNIKNDRNKKL